MCSLARGFGLIPAAEVFADIAPSVLICDIEGAEVDLIPSLPPTCVYQRKLPAATPRKVGPSAAQMREWGLRLMRMGARNQQGEGASDPKQQLPQGVMRQDM